MICRCCKGRKLLEVKVKDLGTLDYRWTIVSCSACDGKGHIDGEDKRRIHHILNEFRQLTCNF